MCGIAGYIEPLNGGVQDTTIHSMLDSLSHRGPDGSGVWGYEWDRWFVRLGHRRLSIIDLEGGKQPLGNHDGSLQITFNGEIFNFLEIKPLLEAKGYSFRTTSDTEVLVQQYAELGVDGLESLNGMFAFALWDKKQETLLLARDRVGIKPLYYSLLPSGGIVFASELTSLLKHPHVGHTLRQSAVEEYFFSDYINSPNAVFSEVRKLPPAHYLQWKNGKITGPTPYWKLSSIKPKERLSSEEELAEELWQVLTRAVKRQLISDVPVGLFLSGGMDSSVITAIAQKSTDRTLKSFTIKFEDRDFDESEHALKVAKHLGTEHIVETITEETMLKTIDRALDSLDEPLADHSILPTFLLSEVAARSVKVVLTGDGGDELWAGYQSYFGHQLAEIYRVVPNIVQENLLLPSLALLPMRSSYQSLEWKIKRFLNRWEVDPFRRHLRWMANTDLSRLETLFSNFGADTSLFREAYARFSQCKYNSLLALDFHTYLPGSVLTKVDRASMKNSLETRPPFLDSEFIEWSYSLPFEYKLKMGKGKYLLRKAAARYLPEEILARPKKGFSIPLARWLSGPLAPRVERFLKESPLWELGFIDQRALQSLYHALKDKKEDTSKTIWAAFVLDHWLRRVHRPK